MINDVLSTPPAVEQLAIESYVEIDLRVDGAERDGIEARWEFGRLLLHERRGKKLPKGRLDAIAHATGKSRQELQYRMQFASRYPTKTSLSNALDNDHSWRDIVQSFSGSPESVHFSSEHDEWETPQGLFDALNNEFRFTLDVCATPTNAKCEQYYTPKMDGLVLPWKGVCWMNPPYGETIAVWMRRAYEAKNEGTTVVCLVPARTDTAWWWDYCRFGAVRFLRGRLRFVGAAASAPFPSAVVVFRPTTTLSTRYWEWRTD